MSKSAPGIEIGGMANVTITNVHGIFATNLMKFSFNANIYTNISFLFRRRENFEPHFSSISDRQCPGDI